MNKSFFSIKALPILLASSLMQQIFATSLINVSTPIPVAGNQITLRLSNSTPYRIVLTRKNNDLADKYAGIILVNSPLQRPNQSNLYSLPEKIVLAPAVASCKQPYSTSTPENCSVAGTNTTLNLILINDGYSQNMQLQNNADETIITTSASGLHQMSKQFPITKDYYDNLIQAINSIGYTVKFEAVSDNPETNSVVNQYLSNLNGNGTIPEIGLNANYALTSTVLDSTPCPPSWYNNTAWWANSVGVFAGVGWAASVASPRFIFQAENWKGTAYKPADAFVIGDKPSKPYSHMSGLHIASALASAVPAAIGWVTMSKSNAAQRAACQYPQVTYSFNSNSDSSYPLNYSLIAHNAVTGTGNAADYQFNAKDEHGNQTSEKLYIRSGYADTFGQFVINFDVTDAKPNSKYYDQDRFMNLPASPRGITGVSAKLEDITDTGSSLKLKYQIKVPPHVNLQTKKISKIYSDFGNEVKISDCSLSNNGECQLELENGTYAHYKAEAANSKIAKLATLAIDYKDNNTNELFDYSLYANFIVNPGKYTTTDSTIPSGEYLQSCKDPRVTDSQSSWGSPRNSYGKIHTKVLTASCKDDDSEYIDAVLDLNSCDSGSGIINNNGILTCTKPHIIPPGDYLQQCKDSMVIKPVDSSKLYLRATCKKNDNEELHDILDLAECGNNYSITEKFGRLSCVKVDNSIEEKRKQLVTIADTAKEGKDHFYHNHYSIAVSADGDRVFNAPEGCIITVTSQSKNSTLYLGGKSCPYGLSVGKADGGIKSSRFGVKHDGNIVIQACRKKDHTDCYFRWSPVEGLNTGIPGVLKMNYYGLYLYQNDKLVWQRLFDER